MNEFSGFGVGAAAEGAASAGNTGEDPEKLTPHKIPVCHLMAVFAQQAQARRDEVAHFRFDSVAHHNRLQILLLTLTKLSLKFLEPRLANFLRQLKKRVDSTDGSICEHLTSTLSPLNSPNMFNFFDGLRGVLTEPACLSAKDTFLDTSSWPGVLRCCCSNSMTFELRGCAIFWQIL